MQSLKILTRGQAFTKILKFVVPTGNRVYSWSKPQKKKYSVLKSVLCHLADELYNRGEQARYH